MATEDLERRIARLESRAEIAELLARYAFLLDDHEFDALGELFTPDARFGSPGSTHTGRAAIVANYRTAGDLYPITLHEARGFVLDFTDDDHARGQVTGFSEQASARHTVITSFRYDDEYVRLDGRWRFASRQVRTLYAMTHAEHASGGLAWRLRKRWPHRSPAPAQLPAYHPEAGTDPGVGTLLRRHRCWSSRSRRDPASPRAGPGAVMTMTGRTRPPVPRRPGCSTRSSTRCTTASRWRSAWIAP